MSDNDRLSKSQEEFLQMVDRRYLPRVAERCRKEMKPEDEDCPDAVLIKALFNDSEEELLALVSSGADIIGICSL